MESETSSTTKRLRSENCSINCQSSLSDDSLSCPYCTFITKSQADFDFHNHVHHQHVCSQCLQVFPNYFLLDLHMDEKHNYFVKSQSYRCLIESCSEVFASIEQRCQHINDEHHTQNRHLNDIYLLFANRQDSSTRPKERDAKFGCDSQKTFVRNSRLRPRQFLDTHWDAED